MQEMQETARVPQGGCGIERDADTAGADDDACLLSTNKGERNSLCSPAMALVLAQMSQEEGDSDEGGALQVEACRAPTMAQMLQARFNSPTCSEAGGGDHQADHAATSPAHTRPGFWGAAWCCAHSRPGRIIAALLDKMPWSPRKVRALEHSMLAPIPDGDALSGWPFERNCKGVSWRAGEWDNCAGSCTPISRADCSDSATVLVTVIFGAHLVLRLLGRRLLPQHSVTQMLCTPLPRFVQIAQLLGPMSLAFTLLGARYRHYSTSRLAASLQRSHSTLQQAETICKVRVALSLGLMVDGGAGGKLPPVSRLEKWMSRRSSNGLDKPAIIGTASQKSAL